jgi:hypothetical protein
MCGVIKIESFVIGHKLSGNTRYSVITGEGAGGLTVFFADIDVVNYIYLL